MILCFFLGFTLEIHILQMYTGKKSFQMCDQIRCCFSWNSEFLFAVIAACGNTGWDRVAESVSEVFEWSRIPNNIRSRSRRFLSRVGFLTTLGVGVGFFCSTPEIQLHHSLHHTPKLGIPVEMVQFLLKILLKEIILAVYHDLHWLLVATKLLTSKLHSRYVKELESEILERSELESESDILPPTPQPWLKGLKN